MGENTKIEWCDHTFNPWRGCTKVAAGCANCYAESQAKRNTGTLGVWGPNGTRVVAAESAWKQVEKWDCDRCQTCKGHGVVTAWSGSLAAGSLAVDARDCPTCGGGEDYRPAIFCGSMCDVFEDWPGPMINGAGAPFSRIEGACEVLMTMSDVRTRVFNLIDATRLTWLLLTKRPENVRPMWKWRDCGDNSGLCENWQKKRPNVWLGTSIACQEDADKNIPELLKCRDLCAGIFLSIEPLVSPVSFRWAKWCPIPFNQKTGATDELDGLRMIEQVIIGGESGPHARPCRPEWIRSIARQCADAGVRCFVKQLGANIVTRNDMIEDEFNGREGWTDPHVEYDIHGFRENYQGADCRVRLRDKKGGDPAEWPEDLRQYRRLAWKGGAA